MNGKVTEEETLRGGVGWNRRSQLPKERHNNFSGFLWETVP